METISSAELVALHQGAADARYALFRADGSLYCSIGTRGIEHDADYWRNQGYTLKKVEHEQERAA